MSEPLLGATTSAIQKPPAFDKLAWGPVRARRFADQTVDLWQEFLERLPHLPVAPSGSAAQVAEAVARSIPNEALPDDELFAYL